ncbi:MULTISPECIES: sigma-54-dependent transcriptional regulator [Bilophila]|uniref:sigma-54-dependent transcriptional regulator n=1 Tax=Bilophila TaxID=35832 RepID=UPI00257C4774|nr:sigma-54 dependent transcriptional regulator [Bilophila sp.]MBS5454420.1 sigma-54-dependent Fis family transcriptional regulator [Bilophila sp.]
MYTILIVDDEANLLEVLAVALENMGYGTVTAETAEEALAVLEEREVHLVLSDLRLPGLNGRELMEKVKAANPDLPVVIMTAYASLKEAVEIIKEGAFDYTVKPFELDALEATIASALRYYALGRDNRDLREQLQTASAGQFVGQSPAYLALLRNVSEVSASSANVLITGESGTGKEVVAKAIHYGGPRAKAPLVTINCAAIPEQLLESELFGHARGAFTGATSNRKGRFAQADGGTLFLDEIGDMPLALQAKILRCIQEKAIEPVGSNTTQKVDVRIIAATNQNLVEAIEKGKFRRDLYYRLNVYPIIMPSLRERKEDIPLLAEHFALRAAGEMGKVPVTFTEAALDILKNHTWPGNIRELENCIERLTIIASGTAITPERLASCAVPGGGDASSPSAPGSAFPLDLDRKLAETERDLILRALEETGGVQVKAAELLNISERSMWHRIKKLGINIINKKEMI